MHRRRDRFHAAPVPTYLSADPPDPPCGDLDHESPVRISEEALRALLPDDDYEPLPDPTDFWIDREE
jgi:hypothetical protein